MLDLEVAEAVAREALKTQRELKAQLLRARLAAIVSATAAAVLLAVLLWGCA